MSSNNRISRVQYFYTTVKDQPGEAYQILNQLAELGVNLMALNVIPTGPHSTQMAIFPEDSNRFRNIAEKAGFSIIGPYSAILVQGNDEVGALSDVHKKLYQAGVNVYASNGVSDGKGDFGYVIYVRPEAFEKATEVLRI